MTRMYGEIKKNKVRFNAADLLICAAALLVLFNFIVSAIFAEGAQGEYRLTVTISEEEARQMDLAGVTALSGAEVLLLDAGKDRTADETSFDAIPIGKLEKDRAPGETTLYVIVGREILESVKFEYGAPVGVKVGQLFSRNAIVENIEEVSGK